MARKCIDLKANTAAYLARNEVTNAYFREIYKNDALSSKEENELFEKWANNWDWDAREKLCNSYLKFVVSVAKNYASDEKVNDLIEAGNIGLIKAIDSVHDEKVDRRYDWTRGNRFTSFAVWYVKQAIQLHILEHNTLVRKTNNSKTSFHLNKMKERYFAEFGRYPTDDELIDMLAEKDIKINDSSDLYDVRVNSINTTFNDDDDTAFENSVYFTSHTSTENEYNREAEKDYSASLSGTLMEVLDERERMIVEYTYGIGHTREYTMPEIAEELNISSERVRQLKNSALKKMRAVAIAKGVNV